MPDGNSETPHGSSGEPGQAQQPIRLDVTHLRRGGMMQMLYTLTDQCREGEPANPLLDDCERIGVDQVFESIVNLRECQNGLYRAERCNEEEDPSSGVVIEFDYRLVLVEPLNAQGQPLTNTNG